MGTPRLIIVSGPAGSGKTTLAHRLAAAVGCPALCRDELKEGMVISNPGFVPATSDPLTRRTYGLFFELIDRLLAAEVTLVAEAAFQHRLWVQGLDSLTAAHDLVVLRCFVPAEVAAERVRRRMNDQATRAAHADGEYLAAAAPFDAIHVEATTVDIDTSTDDLSDLAGLLAFVTTPPAGRSGPAHS